jgi:hypothetical protein
VATPAAFSGRFEVADDAGRWSPPEQPSPDWDSGRHSDQQQELQPRRHAQLMMFFVKFLLFQVIISNRPN